MISLIIPTVEFEVYNCPGKYMSETELKALHEEIHSVATSCLDEIPHYQCLTGERREYARLLIAVARDKNGKMMGFCSSYILEGMKSEMILHLGLTCVLPVARRMGLTHKLTSRVVMTYLFKYSLFNSAWISNIACVISSLGNVALHFEDVYPSPFITAPTDMHIELAQWINQKYRQELYINQDAIFREQNFVFERSVSGTMFEKSESDKRYFHRDQDLTDFYLNLIDFKNGDEILQIGKVSLLTFPKYLVKNFKRKFSGAKVLKDSQTVA